MLAAGVLTAASCSDFSDYNEEPVSSQPSAENTLWQNIKANAQLSQFASLVERTGFDSYLQEPRAYTVWAPANDQFDYAAYQQLDNTTLLNQFVKNHVADFNYVASGSLDGSDPVHMLSGKSFAFAGNGQYTFGKNTVSQANVASSNGILHVINGANRFYPNLYEFFGQSTDDGIDSLVNYVKRYEQTTLDLENSEKGPMVDGMQTYVDSVMVTTNSLFGRSGLNANVENEDSSYTFLMPTNEAYMEMYNRVKSCYNFIGTTLVQDIEKLDKANATSTSGDNTRNGFNKSVSVNAAYLQDSLTRRLIASHLVYSNTNAYNKFINERPAIRTIVEGQYRDSVYTTTRNLLSNPGEIFEDHQVGEPIEMSNGFGRIVDSLAFYPWEAYCPQIVATPSRNLGRSFTCVTRNVRVEWPEMAEQLRGPGYEEFNYTLIRPSGRNKPDFFIHLPNVQSTTYHIYVVVLPWEIGEKNADYGDTIPRTTPMNFDLSYCGTNGKLANYHFTTGASANPSSFSLTTAFLPDPLKVDTLDLGEFTFPVNYRGLGDGYCPSLYISSPVNVYTPAQVAQYSREFRIYAIILKPVELDEFEANNK